MVAVVAVVAAVAGCFWSTKRWERRQWTRTTNCCWSFDVWVVVKWLHCSSQDCFRFLWLPWFRLRGFPKKLSLFEAFDFCLPRLARLRCLLHVPRPHHPPSARRTAEDGLTFCAVPWRPSFRRPGASTLSLSRFGENTFATSFCN